MTETRVAERPDKYDQLLHLADVFDRSGDELRAMSGLGTEVLLSLIHISEPTRPY